MEEETYLAIERYLANEMGAEERLVFEERMSHEKDLGEKLTIYRSLSETLSSKYKREDEEKLFIQNLGKMKVEGANDTVGKVIKMNWYTWAAAASVALLCVVLLYNSISKPDYAQYAHYEPLALVERGSNDAIKWQAQENFNSKQYEKALFYFDALLKRDENNIELKYYRGIALLELNRVEEANIIFEQVQASESIYKDKGTWMLALSALKQKDYKKCEAFLKKIPQGSAEYGNAQKLLRGL